MALVLVQQLSVSDLTPCIVSMRDTYISGSELVMQPKFGTLVLDFKPYIGMTCFISFKRSSGNGIVMISENWKSDITQITSQTQQSLSFRITENSLITFNRTFRSRGDISILNVNVFRDSQSKEQFNQMLNRCSEYSCIRFAEEKLLASSGSFITGNNIILKTEPSNMFYSEGNKVKFVGSCEIIELKVDEPIIVDSEPLSVKLPEQLPIKTININNFEDIVSEETIKFSRPIKHTYDPSYIFNGFSKIFINTRTGNLWFNIVKNCIPNVMLVEKDPDVSISCVGNLIPAKKMYIEPFENIEESDFEKLSIADHIYCSSRENAETIYNKILKNVTLMSKRLPIIKSTVIDCIRKDFILLNNRDDKETTKILECIKDLGIKVVLLNARGRYPSFVIPANEYIQHSDFIYLVENAKCYIDIPKIHDEVFGCIDICLSLGTQVITSSLSYINIPEVLIANDLQQLPELINKSQIQNKRPDEFANFIDMLFN